MPVSKGDAGETYPSKRNGLNREKNMSYETIKYEVEDNILTLTLHRPEKMNAFTGQMMLDMIDAFDRADADDDVVQFHAEDALDRLHFIQRE